MYLKNNVFFAALLFSSQDFECRCSFFVCSSSRNMPGYLFLVVFRVASMQRWGTPTARRPWTLFTSSPQHRPAGRSSSSWGVGSLKVEAAVLHYYYYCYYNSSYYYMDTFCRLIEHLLSSARCFSSSAGSCPERLLQQLRPDQPQYQSGRRHYGKNAAEKKKKTPSRREALPLWQRHAASSDFRGGDWCLWQRNVACWIKWLL